MRAEKRAAEEIRYIKTHELAPRRLKLLRLLTSLCKDPLTLAQKLDV